MKRKKLLKKANKQLKKALDNQDAPLFNAAGCFKSIDSHRYVITFERIGKDVKTEASLYVEVDLETVLDHANRFKTFGIKSHFQTIKALNIGRYHHAVNVEFDSDHDKEQDPEQGYFDIDDASDEGDLIDFISKLNFRDNIAALAKIKFHLKDKAKEGYFLFTDGVSVEMGMDASPSGERIYFWEANIQRAKALYDEYYQDKISNS